MVASKFLHHLALEQQLSCTSQLELSDAKSCGVKKCHRSAQNRNSFFHLKCLEEWDSPLHSLDIEGSIEEMYLRFPMTIFEKLVRCVIS